MFNEDGIITSEEQATFDKLNAKIKAAELQIKASCGIDYLTIVVSFKTRPQAFMAHLATCVSFTDQTTAILA